MSKIKEFYKSNIEFNLISKGSGETVELTKYIKRFKIVKRYVNYMFPFFDVDLKLPTDIYMKIANTKSNKYSLKIKTFNVEDDNMATSTIVDAILTPYNNKKAIDSITKTPQEENGEDNPEKDVPKHEYNMILIDNERASVFSRIVNKCYNKTNVYNAVLNIFDKQFKNLGDVIVEPFDNNVIYDNVLIPPLSIKDAVDMVHDMYGIYKSGVLFFIDNNDIYLTRLNGHINISDEKRPLVNFDFIKTDELQENGLTQGLYYDTDNDVYVNISTAHPAIEESSDTNKKVLGEKIIIAEYDDNFDIKKKVIDVSDNDDSQKVRYYWNSFGEDIFIDNMINDSKLANITYKVIFTGFHPDRISPINRYNIKVNGEYVESRLVSTITSFIKDGDSFKMMGNAEFIKNSL